MDNHCIGVVLAGGRSSRMGRQDKAFCQLGQRTLIETAIARAAPQVDELIINSNSEARSYRDLGLPIIGDCVEGQLGPLAGILSAMLWIGEHRPTCRWLASFATDTPFIPDNLVETLVSTAQRRHADLVCPRSNGRSHPVIGLWSIHLASDLQDCLVYKQMRKVDQWTQRHSLVEIDFDSEPIDPFFNINTADDLIAAEKMLKVLNSTTTKDKS